MQTLRRTQTTARQGLGVLRLRGSEFSEFSSEQNKLCKVSPYFQTQDTRKIGTTQEYSLILALMKAVIYADNPTGSGDFRVNVVYYTGSTFTSASIVSLAGLDFDATSLPSDIQAAVLADAVTNGYSIATTDIIDGMGLPQIVVGPASYQTIVSQTGTAAPAVQSGFTPVSSYASGTTFTWARTGAGVYTLTASTAVFNTSGKTGVFVGGLNNLNGQYKCVVTSSTVITFTFAVQSLAVLGLLGFTATNTDALLTNTMIYVQTY